MSRRGGTSDRARVERVARWVMGDAFPNSAPFVAYVADLSGAPTIRDDLWPVFRRDNTLTRALDIRGWIGHTLDEVHVGGRWVKLNGDRLGQNALDPQYLGLMTR